PVVAVTNVTLSVGHGSVAASTLFTASDPGGHTITTYGFMDTGSGDFVLSGVAQPNNQEFDVSAAQLSQLTYQSVAGSLDTIAIQAYDGTTWGNWSYFTITAPPLVVESDGSTSLTELGDQFYLD